MRGLVSLLVLAACAPQGEVPPVAVDVEPTPVDGTASADAAPARATREPRTSLPLFVFERDGERLAFFPPNRVELHRPGKPICTSELPDGGNMYSGEDVQRAFEHEHVRAALAAPRRYAANTRAKIAGHGHAGTLTWLSGCSTCAEVPPGVAQLRSVLDVVHKNRQLTCP